MLRWTLIFLLVAIVSGSLGFASIGIAAAATARLLFYLFLGAALMSVLVGVVNRA